MEPTPPTLKSGTESPDSIMESAELTTESTDSMTESTDFATESTDSAMESTDFTVESPDDATESIDKTILWGEKGVLLGDKKASSGDKEASSGNNEALSGDKIGQINGFSSKSGRRWPETGGSGADGLDWAGELPVADAQTRKQARPKPQITNVVGGKSRVLLILKADQLVVILPANPKFVRNPSAILSLLEMKKLECYS